MSRSSRCTTARGSSAWWSRPTSRFPALARTAIDELWDQTKAVYNPTDDYQRKVYPKDIAFNVIPHIDVFLEDGSTKEEWKMVAETKKIIDPSIKVTATCVRVPVFVGHSEAINIEFEDFLDEDEARDILREAPGIMVVDKREDGGYVTPKECVGDFATFISRIRQDSTIDNGINLWCVSDNLRKGRRAERGADRRGPGPRSAQERLIKGHWCPQWPRKWRRTRMRSADCGKAGTFGPPKPSPTPAAAQTVA